MGRKRTIDRDAILDAAEAIVTESGAGQLTFDAIAARAGVSKGGALYCFPSKQALIAAMAERDLKRFEDDVARHAEGMAAEDARPLKAHVAATREESAALAARAASLMAALAEMPDEMEPVRRHYRNLFDRIDGKTAEGRRARLALLACEGAFLLRGLGLMDLHEGEWEAMFDDIGGLVLDDAGSAARKSTSAP